MYADAFGLLVLSASLTSVGGFFGWLLPGIAIDNGLTMCYNLVTLVILE